MDGESANLTCVVHGKPTPKVEWYHDNKPIKEGKEITILQDTEGVCSLAIVEVFPEDAGEYTCRAVNPVGEAVCTSSLLVEGERWLNKIVTVDFINIPHGIRDPVTVLRIDSDISA